VKPGDDLQFKNESDCGAWICHRQVDGRLPFKLNFTVTVPEVNFTALPTASVQAPAAVGSCDNNGYKFQYRGIWSGVRIRLDFA